MGQRVADSEVKALVDTVRDATPFIRTASLIIDEELADQGMTDGRLTQIELYLSAHFLTVAEERGGMIRSATGESAETYSDIYKGMEGFNITRFGQQAISLDESGKLASMSKVGGKAEFRVV